MAVGESSNKTERKGSPVVTEAPAAQPHPSLAHALAAFQAERPRVVKDSTNPHLGKMYAGLDAFESVILPVLAKHGLAWTCAPTLNEERAFVLRYELIHAASGDKIAGVYPLTEGNPQIMGGAITYAKRYCLSAVTGVSADEDDDGHAASSAPPQRQPQRPPQQRPQQGQQQRPAQGREAAPPQDEPPQPETRPSGLDWASLLDRASNTDSLAELRTLWKSWGVDNAPKSIQDQFAARVEAVRRADQAIADAAEKAVGDA